MSLGINLGAQNLGPGSWKYFSPIFVGQIPGNIFHPYLVRIWPQIWTESGPNLTRGHDPSFLILIMVHLSWIYCGSVVNLWWICRELVPDASSWRIKFMKIMEFGLKWVHMARYELILRLDGALWLTIISGSLLTPKRGLPGWGRPAFPVLYI